ncbi:5'-nucleotidase [Escherichia coli]
MRVIKTLEAGGYMSMKLFSWRCRENKSSEGVQAHILFDDQDAHLIAAAKVVPSGKVPYASNSELAEREAS